MFERFNEWLKKRSVKDVLEEDHTRLLISTEDDIRSFRSKRGSTKERLNRQVEVYKKAKSRSDKEEIADDILETKEDIKEIESELTERTMERRFLRRVERMRRNKHRAEKAGIWSDLLRIPKEDMIVFLREGKVPQKLKNRRLSEYLDELSHEETVHEKYKDNDRDKLMKELDELLVSEEEVDELSEKLTDKWAEETKGERERD